MSDEEELCPSIVVGPWTLTPVVRVRCSANQVGKLVYAHGEKRAVAVLVQRGEQQWRLDIADGPYEAP